MPLAAIFNFNYLSLVGALACGATSGAAIYALNYVIPKVTTINLHNYVVASDDPTAIISGHIQQIAAKYTVNKQDDTFNAELYDLYYRFVFSIILMNNEDLKGHEVQTILNFKSVLGVDDPDAVAMHMEIGRHIFRQILETGDRDGDLVQRLGSLFVSSSLEVFKVTDSQLAEGIFKEHTRKLVEENISTTLGALKSRARAVVCFKIS